MFSIAFCACGDGAMVGEGAEDEGSFDHSGNNVGDVSDEKLLVSCITPFGSDFLATECKEIFVTSLSQQELVISSCEANGGSFKIGGCSTNSRPSTPEAYSSSSYGFPSFDDNPIYYSSSSSVFPVIRSSSSAMGSSSAMSSSSAQSSSSAMSSSSRTESSIYKGDLWNGANGDYRVNTGFDDDSGKSGYWLVENDGKYGGSSLITWPCELGNENDPLALAPVIDECAGLCGDVYLNTGYDYPYTSVGFNLADPDLAGVDISAWGGICVQYEASGIAPIIELVPADQAHYTLYNNYTTTLSVRETSANLPWQRFKVDAGWGNYVNQAEFLTRVVSIRFKFSGRAGDRGSFNIKSIGTYGSCN